MWRWLHNWKYGLPPAERQRNQNKYHTSHWIFEVLQVMRWLFDFELWLRFCFNVGVFGVQWHSKFTLAAYALKLWSCLLTTFWKLETLFTLAVVHYRAAQGSHVCDSVECIFPTICDFAVLLVMLGGQLLLVTCISSNCYILEISGGCFGLNFVLIAERFSLTSLLVVCCLEWNNVVFIVDL